jgi:hypothetical protein
VCIVKSFLATCSYNTKSDYLVRQNFTINREMNMKNFIFLFSCMCAWSVHLNWKVKKEKKNITNKKILVFFLYIQDLFSSCDMNHRKVHLYKLSWLQLKWMKKYVVKWEHVMLELLLIVKHSKCNSKANYNAITKMKIWGNEFTLSCFSRTW